MDRTGISAFRAFLIPLCILFSGLGQVYAAPTDLVGSSAWSALLQGIKFDALGDTQANKAGTEIVGDATHPTMYVNYDDNGTTSGPDPELDDTLSFRIRIGDETKSTHSAYAFVGIEANGDGVLDAFVSSGSGNTSIWDAGTDANTSPSTTDLANSAYATYAHNASNYNFAPVSATNDPDWDGTSDLGLDGNTDVFVSFSIPVSALDAFLAGPDVGITFTPTTQLRLVSLTATQTNSLNSDFNGIGNSATDDWGQTYAALGILSDPITSSGIVDATPPSAPTVTPVSTGSSTPTVTGTYDSADAAGGFSVTVNSVTYTLGVDAALSTVGNNWSLTVPAGDALGTGTYEVTATATDGAGNAASDTSSNELVIDATPPTAPTVAPVSSSSSTPTITGTYDSLDAAGGFAVTVNSVTYTLGVDAAITATGNDWSLTIPAGNALGTGTYEVTAMATDGAGNAASDTSSNELVIDATPPSTPTVNALSGNDTTPRLTGTYDSTDAAGGFAVTVNSVTYTLGVDAALSAVGNDWSLTIPAGNALGTGTYEVTATATDGAGNASSDTSSNELVIDADSDGDGIINSVDVDDDNDGIPDSLEGDGLVDTDLDGVPDSLDLDADNDGLFDLAESGTLLLNPDSNNDGRIDTTFSVGSNGLADAAETIADSGTINFTLSDSDSDGVRDYRDLDSDNDGLPDVIESGGSDPDADGRPGSGVPVVDASGVPTGGGLMAIDTDGDNISDFRDLDADNDGLADLVEAGGTDSNGDGRVDGFIDLNNDGFDDGIAASPLSPPDDDADGTPDFQDGDDTDGDGVPDSVDLDNDNDGIPDLLEGNGAVDTDFDGIPDSLDLDADNDGLLDLDEAGLGVTGLDLNTDGRIDLANPVGSNGLADAVETVAGSGTINYTLADSDADGVPDSNDRDSDNDGLFDVIEADGADPDNDGVIGTGVPAVNGDGLSGLASLAIIDTDSDLVPDYRDLDTDNDGLYDVAESTGSDPDNDGLLGSGTPVVDSNGAASGAGLPPVDTDSDTVPNYRDRDSDNDGLTDTSEAGGSDPDGDGIVGSGIPPVNAQGVPTGGGLAPIDTDTDGSIDTLDLDSDGDGIFDLVEAGGTDSNNDGRVDGFTDSNGDGLDDGLATTPLVPPDTDGDGIPDYRDNDDTDNDGIPDSVDADDDNDAIPDILEGDTLVDTDSDGIPDSRDLDADNDGIPDLAESGANYTLLDADGNGRVDAGTSIGSNGLADSVETFPDSGLIAYNGGILLDTDTDGIADYRDRDSDNDGIFDVTEAGGSDPDRDGLVGSGAPPVNPQGVAGLLVVSDTDGDGIADQLDRDSDNDGIPDTIEAGVPDPDLDGVAGPGLPVIDSNGTTSGSGVNPPDSDSDGTPDMLDLDSDNDGTFDLVEAGGTDTDNNGLVDGYMDNDGDGLDDGLAAIPLPNLLQGPVIIETGLRGVGGCTISHTTRADPTLLLIVIASLLYLRRRQATHQERNER